LDSAFVLFIRRGRIGELRRQRATLANRDTDLPPNAVPTLISKIQWLQG
jgi:hypothetical protein